MSVEEQIKYDAVTEAMASANIEGYEIDSQSENLCMMLSEGLITLDEYIGLVLKMSEMMAV